MPSCVAIIGYGMGNVASLMNALQAIGADSFVAECPGALERGTHIILPRVGAFPIGMEKLRALGYPAVLRDLVLRGMGQPVTDLDLEASLSVLGGKARGDISARRQLTSRDILS